MIRLVLFLASLALIALGIGWIADRPGQVSVTWLGYRVDTSILVAASGLIALTIVLLVAWSILRALWRSPEQVSLFFRHRRAMKGYLALSRGLIAVGAGDLKLARRYADDAARLSPGDPLALLLTAQSAQMAGDRAAAEHAFRAMAAREDTRLLGLRGLYVEAQRRDDAVAARLVAEEAAKNAPMLPWAGQAVLDYRCRAGDWAGALESLEGMKGAMGKADYRRKRAVLLTARAQALDEIERDQARALILEAVKLAPDLTPAAVMAGRRLAEAGEQRGARKILETAWAANPHPDIAAAYANVRLGDSARERLARMQKLAAMVPGQLEGALAVARAALEAAELTTARAALAPYLSAPTRRVATLMADLEEAEHAAEGRVREWMARAVHASGDPVWTAEGVISERWLPVTPSGRLDGFQWRVPLAEIGASRPARIVERAPEIETKADDVPPAPETNSEPAPARMPAKKITPKIGDKSAAAKPVEPVIPLVHAPDDPGPDGHVDADPVPESSASPPGGWQRFLEMFR